MRFRHFSIAVAIAVLCPIVASAQSDPDTVKRIVTEGKDHSEIMKLLTHLTQKIGPRLTASPQLEKSYKWTQERFKQFGCKNVHLEEWGEFPLSFERSKKQIGRMVSPEKIDFEFTTASWTYGTKRKTKGEAILEPTTMEEFAKVKDRLKGAWLISKRSAFRGSGATMDELTKALKESGFAGTVFGSRNDLVITSGRYNAKLDEIPLEPRITVTKKNFDAILAHLEQNEKVELEFDMPNKLKAGPVKIYNVIAEIPGTEKPDEVVIISGHLDSWDGPGSQGAQDNGTGSCVALEAARILGKAKAKPKRTIRFILWTGEEQGLFGSAAYVKAHKDEMSKISAVFVDDGGTNYEGGVSCTAEMEPILKEAFAPAMEAFPEMPMRISIVNRVPRGGGSDHASFNAVGVPGFFWFETGRNDYNHVHHTQFDRLETAIPEYLVQSATNSAATAYIVACAPTLLPREKPPVTTPQ